MTDSKTQAGGVEIPKNMSNDELKTAIDYAFQKLYTTGSSYPHYAPMLEHYKALLKEQEHRAQAALIAADAQDAELAKAKAALQFIYEECRAPVRDYLNAIERQLLRCNDGTYPSHYRPLFEKEATRYSNLLDQIDAAIDEAIKGAARGEGGDAKV